MLLARRHYRFLFLAIVLVVMPGHPARAAAINECIDSCFSGFSCASVERGGSIDPVCEGGRDRCVKQCNENISRGTAPAPVTGACGAIAYDKKTGSWGIADASQSKSDAKKSALAYCGKRRSDCEIVENFSNTCAAVAAGAGNRLGWAVDENARQAGLNAIKKCGDSGSSKTKMIKAAVSCSSTTVTLPEPFR